ncbi:leucine-rich repeat domain-containing protein [Pararhodospirillum photometricum]|uniref:leucine-rich repeat domain-containing protein n=1 Tax=Pararhodospirillum photometricum TaxID=1084 RepID=UPI00059F8888|nr:leucine-rich repeat domain-containing protein [Pararhodospirillum photometricum]
MTGTDEGRMRAEDAFREAEERIAAWTPGRPLDLAIEGLERIPDSIGGLSKLTDLWFTGWDETRRITVGGRGVSDLGPLAGLTALQSLDCSWTLVSDLGPLAGLTALQSLDCGWTLVSDLGPLAGLTALQRLDCDRTLVSDLGPLADLTALQRLDCNLDFGVRPWSARWAHRSPEPQLRRDFGVRPWSARWAHRSPEPQLRRDFGV